MHALLTLRGVTFSTVALGTALTNGAVTAAPAHLAAGFATTALASAAVSGGVSFTFLKLMSMTKLKMGVISLFVVAGAVTPWVMHHQSQARLRHENEPVAPEA